jgi:hypothetical protein
MSKMKEDEDSVALLKALCYGFPLGLFIWGMLILAFCL